MKTSAMAKIVGMVVVVIGMAARSSHATVLVSENFNVDPIWTSTANATTNGNNFGLKNSSNAGAVANEAGGTFARLTAEAYYADTTLGGSLSLSDTIQGSGKFDANNTSSFTSDVQIGHLSSGTTNGAFIGLGVIDNGASQVRIRAELLYGSTVIVTSVTAIPINGDYSFSYTYNPNLGSFGRLTLIVTGASISTITKTYDLSTVDRSSGVTFDGFGIGYSVNTIASGSSSINTGDVFMDDVTYTAVAVPEPTSITLAIIGLAGLFGRSQRRHARS